MDNTPILAWSQSMTSELSGHTADPIQNMLAPYARRAQGVFHNIPVQFEYISLADAYTLIKKAMESRITVEEES